VTIDVLVVDDEPLARARLRRLVEEEPDLRLIGECVNGEEAVAAIRAASPRLVFLDVDMPDMTGFDVLEAVPATRRPAVVFVTAYDEFAVRAFEVHALDYLLKPFDASRFATTLARVRSQLRSPRDASLEPLAALLEEMRTRQQSLERSLRQPGAAWPERLVVRSGQELVFVRVRDIDWLSSADNYVELHTGGQTFLLRETISRLELKLDPTVFARIHRGTIVNIACIHQVLPATHGDFALLLQSGARLIASRTYAARLKRLVSNVL